MPPTAILCQPADDTLAPFRRLQSLEPCRLRQQLRNHLVEEHLGLVRQAARRLAARSGLREELYSEGCLALIAAVERFDPERGFRFSTFATACIRNRMFRWLKRETRRNRVVRPAAEITMPAGRDAAVNELDADDERRHVTRAVERLPERERTLVTLRFGLEANPSAMSFREIGRHVALSKERVRQIVSQSLERLKDALT